MGSGKSSTNTIVEKHFIQDPQMKKQLQDSRLQISQLSVLVKMLEIQLKEAMQKGKKMKSPYVYRELKEEAWNIFLTNVQKLSFEEKIPKKYGERHHVLIGNISAGKTSMINHACKCSLPVGIGEITQELRKVASSPNGKVHIWDSPGVNEDFAFYDPQVLAYFHSADRIFIIYPDSLKSCKQMIQVLYKIKPSNTFLVRSMCDRGETGQHKTIQQELQTDRSLLKQWDIDIPVMGTSAFRDASYLDNKCFYNLLVGNQ